MFFQLEQSFFGFLVKIFRHGCQTCLHRDQRNILVKIFSQENKLGFPIVFGHNEQNFFGLLRKNSKKIHQRFLVDF